MHRVFSEKGSFYLPAYGEMVLPALPLLAQEEGGMLIGSLEVLFPSLLRILTNLERSKEKSGGDGFCRVLSPSPQKKKKKKKSELS